MTQRMANTDSTLRGINRIRIPIATKLILGFLAIIILTSAIFTIVGIRLIDNRVTLDAHERVRYDLNSAREIYLNELERVSDVIRLTANNASLRAAVASDNIDQVNYDLIGVRLQEALDMLTITDTAGNILLRTRNPESTALNTSHQELLQVVLTQKRPVASTTILSQEDLYAESPLLAEEALVSFTANGNADAVLENREAKGMMLEAAAPILDSENQVIGLVYGGVLLNKNLGIMCQMNQTVFHNAKYKGQDIGLVTIFLDNVGITTCASNKGGARVLGDRVPEEIYNEVIGQGRPWIGRSIVGENGYFSAYEPIRDANYKTVGILHVGLLEQKYLDIGTSTRNAFLGITLSVVLISALFSYFISRRISGPILSLVSASRAVAEGDLHAQVEVRSQDELGEMADAFNTMAVALQERDQKLREFTRRKIMESERLALIGQLSANVAHELNNPLQGIVTYSHLLLENMPDR